MNYGFYLSTAGAITGMRRLDTIANNLANSTTVGFKADMLRTSARLPENIENGGVFTDTNAALDALGGGTLLEQTTMDLSQGPMRKTGSALDVAIEGPGFFMLENPKGANQSGPQQDRLLTRAGSLARDTQGRLVLATSGAAVLGDDGRPILLSDDLDKVHIERDGTVLQGDDEIGRLAVVVPDDVRNLVKEGRDAIRVAGGRTSPAPATTLVHQGQLEDSTVDPVLALAELIKVSRGIEFSTRLMQSHDQMTGRLIDTLGRFS
jgi:flagellar basal-body rod protein FlgF